MECCYCGQKSIPFYKYSHTYFHLIQLDSRAFQLKWNLTIWHSNSIVQLNTSVLTLHSIFQLVLTFQLNSLTSCLLWSIKIARLLNYNHWILTIWIFVHNSIQYLYILSSYIASYSLTILTYYIGSIFTFSYKQICTTPLDDYRPFNF